MSANLPASLAAAAAACGALALLTWRRYLRSRHHLQQRLHPDTGPPTAAVWLAAWATRLDASRPLRPLAVALAGAGVRLRPSCAGGLAAVVLWIAVRLAAGVTGLPLPVAALLTLGAALFAARRGLRLLQEQAAAAAQGQLAEACRLLGGALRAGLSVPQGLALLGAELQAPAGPHFRRLSGELALGMPLESALTGLEQRLPGGGMRLFALAIRLNRRMGGDLAEVLAELGRTLTQRQQVQAAVSAATAEPRFAAALLPVMPVAAALLMSWLLPGFLLPLFTPPGLVLLAVCCLVQWLGLAAVRRLSRIPI